MTSSDRERDLTHLLATVSTIVATVLAIALGMLANAHFSQEKEIHDLEAQVNAQAVRVARMEEHYSEVLRSLERIESFLEAQHRATPRGKDGG